MQEGIIDKNVGFIRNLLDEYNNKVRTDYSNYCKGPEYDLTDPRQKKSKMAYVESIILIGYLKNKAMIPDFQSRYGAYINSIIAKISQASPVLDGYANSIYAYALALEGSYENRVSSKQILENLKSRYSQTNGDKRFYFFNANDKTYSSLSCQMSSYVALAYMELAKHDLKLITEVKPIIDWISSIKSFGEPWNNAVATETLTEAAKLMSKNDANYELRLTASDNEVILNVDKNNIRNYQYKEISTKSGSLEINAVGQGFLSLDVVCEQYNQKANVSDFIDLKVTTSGVINDIGVLKMCIRCKQGDCKEMVILEVQLQSGFKYDTSINNFVGHPYVKVSD